MRHLYELTAADVGRNRITVIEQTRRGVRSCSYSLTGVMGRVLLQDVGRRLYMVRGVLQVENSEQVEKRTGRPIRPRYCPICSTIFTPARAGRVGCLCSEFSASDVLEVLQ